MNLIERAFKRLRGIEPVTIAERKAPTLSHNAMRDFAPKRKRELPASEQGRFFGSWTTRNEGINALLYRGLDKVRARSNDLAHHNPLMSRYLKMVKANIIGGEGVRLQARVYQDVNKETPDQAANDAIESGWREWCAGACDVSQRMSFLDMCGMLVMGTARNGEMLVRKITGRAAGNDFGFALQVLDINRLDTTLNKAPEKGHGQIVLGIELDQYQRPMAYWLKKANAHKVHDSYAMPEYERIPADEIIHLFVQEFEEQLRGLPWGISALEWLKHQEEYQESAIVAAEFGAAKMAFYEQTEADAETLQNGEDQDDTQSADPLPFAEMEAGQIGEVPFGYKVTPFDPTYPHAMYGDFTRETTRRAASGLNVSYHALNNDLTDVSFSSIRSGTLEERDQWMVYQSWFVRSFLEKIYPDWLRYGLAFGQIKSVIGNELPVSKYDKFEAHRWQPRRWPWVDPKKDMETAVLAIKERIKSPQMVCAELGVDYEDVLIEIKAAQDLAEKIGVKNPAQAVPQQLAQIAEDDDDGE